MDTIKEKIRSLEKSHRNVLKPVESVIRVPIQKYLFDIEPNATEKGMAQGRFYESLTAGLYGGFTSDLKFKIDEETYKGSTIPDVIDWGGNKIWESKGFAIYYSCNIMSRQILGNMHIQLNNPDCEFNYALYRHPIKGMHSTYRKSLDDLIQDLSEQTLFSVVLPLNVILHLSIPGNDNGAKAVRHYEGKREYPNCICLNQAFTKKLFFDAEETIDSIGLSSKDYSFKRYLSPEMEVNENKVNPFPIVHISSKNHDKWMKSFAENLEMQEKLTKHLQPYRKKKKKKLSNKWSRQLKLE